MTDRVRVGVIGLGIGRHHVHGYATCEQAELIAVCDLDPSRIKRLTQDVERRWGTRVEVPHTFKDYHEMLALGELDAVSVALPNWLHAPVTLDALRAGKHVLVEKPMALNAQEAQQMKEAAEEAGLKLMVQFNYRFTPPAQVMKRYVENGETGEIYFARTGWHRNRGIPKFGSWFGQRAKAGGGPLIDLGVHRLDLALWLMGHPKPVSVCGATYDHIGSRLAAEQRKDFDVEDLAVAFIRLENGATIILEVSWASNSERREDMFTALYGTKGGMIHRNIGDSYQFEARFFREEYGGLVEVTPRILPQNLETPWQHFVRCILEDREPMASAQHGVQMMKVLDAIYHSAETGHEVLL